MSTRRPPQREALSPWVEAVWTSDVDGPRLERVPAAGVMHVAIRIEGPPSRLIGNAPPRADAVVCGARSGPYDKRACRGRTIGVELRPGAARALFGVSADVLAERHVGLDTLWGPAAHALRAALAAAGDETARMDLLERALQARLRRAAAPHPDVIEAMAWLREGRDVAAIVAGTGRSHRRFIALFRSAVGLAPKRYARVQRFARVLQAASGDAVDWAGIAHAHGYCDQAHLVREFHACAGATPQAWRAARQGQFPPRRPGRVRAPCPEFPTERRHGRA